MHWQPLRSSCVGRAKERCRNELIATMSPANRLRVKLATLLLALAVVAGRAEETPPRFRAMYEDAVVFETALAAESVPPPAGHRVTGITVPHHLVGPPAAGDVAAGAARSDMVFCR
jgi:hypothetical protein